MHRSWLVTLLFLFTIPVSAQERETVSPYPHPYIEGSFNLMPNGYAPTAWGFGGGLMHETKYFVLDSFLGYDNGHKANDATSNNNKGHDRFLRGLAFYKYHSFLIGAGASWSQLSTTNYTKGGPIWDSSAWHPEVGIGGDMSDVMRVTALYFFPPARETTHYPDGTNCNACGNGTHGMGFHFWFPSPARKSHWFWVMNVAAYRFHDTITSPDDPVLTRRQIGHKHFADSTEFMLMYRF